MFNLKWNTTLKYTYLNIILQHALIHFNYIPNLKMYKITAKIMMSVNILIMRNVKCLNFIVAQYILKIYGYKF